MKTLVVYYSLNGNTQRMAEAMADELGADLQPLTLRQPLPVHGFGKYCRACFQMLRRAAPPMRPLVHPPAAYDRLLIGTPVWAGSVAPILRTFLKDHAPAGKEIALFCCHGGAKGRIFPHLRRDLEPANRVCGECDFEEPLKKSPDESVRKARAWARSLWPHP